MDWSYVAGYFDGEGHVHLHQGKRDLKTIGLSWYNSHRESLEAMQAFMQAGHFHVSKQQAHQNKAVHALSIRDRANVLRVLDAMLPHLLVKKDQALDLYAYLDEHPGRTSPLRFKPLHELSTEQLHQWYIIEGQSCAAIAARYGVTAGGIGLLLKRRGIPRRKTGEGLKGQPKSPETRARMLASRQRLWADPAFRAVQTAALSRRKKITATPDEIRRLYWDEQQTLHEIAAKFGVTLYAVGHFMRKHDIATRAASARLHRG